ncbi:hypothetical protein PRK78_005357 [Emydomyces testavorans]|uniref:Uncharacterized protein n=1 Tax=Emydomyces testavorans TaxID=2070801 RepID=A0AAF0IKM5_9EURO|nr:hypothetical protein PRK78_005357 [Emydomyces testavorans]
MSPAMMEAQPEQGSKQLLALANGFNALLEAAKQLTRQEQLLRSRLQSAHDEYLKLASQLAEASTAHQSEVPDSILKPDTDYSSQNVAVDTTEWVRDIEKAGYITSLGAKTVMEASEMTKALMEKRCQPDEPNKSNACPFTKPCVATSMEKDFTTPGTKGTLRCPFVKPNGHESIGSRVAVNGELEKCGNDDLDPIKAEFHSDAPHCVASSTRSATARCPIRYLNDHSPEEIAEFFQKHKHKIPRSHSVCIQRYQKDPQNLRQLDEKYGDIVNMVQGLGVYHQPYLPSSPPLDASKHPETHAAERVERWAEDVSNKSPNADGPPPSGFVDDEAEARGNHFERSLRDVRVGESPSRPWGIHVPISQQPAQSVVASAPAPAPVSNWSNMKGSGAHSPLIPTPPGNEGGSQFVNGRCPFGYQSVKLEGSPNPVQPDRPFNEARTDNVQSRSRSRSPQPRFVFNGPVIFGYSGDSVAKMLEKLGEFGKL